MRIKTKHSKRAEMAAWLLLALLTAGLAGLCACGKKEVKKMEPGGKEAAQETPLATLGEEVISLEEAVFYTRMLQESWEYSYYPYYGETLWQETIDGEEKPLGELLKRDVLDALTEIHLLCAHAEAYGVELTEEEREAIAGRAEKFMESNTPAVLEAAGATTERVEAFLLRNQLASKVSEALQEGYAPEVDEEGARVGKFTYALFATTGTFDAEGNQTPFTGEELKAVRAEAEAFAVQAQELGDISAAGEAFSHTVIDVYYNGETDGGAHPLVAQTARELQVGGVSELLETEEGYYVVQRVSEYDEAATLENIEWQKSQAKEDYCTRQIAVWTEETPLDLDENLWAQVKVETLLTDPALLE